MCIYIQLYIYDILRYIIYYINYIYIIGLGPVTGVLFCSVFTHVYAAFVFAARIHVATTITVVKKSHVRLPL